MEIVQALAAFFVVFAVALAVVQVLASWSLQVIAEKNELPDFAAFLAWIPVLNIYPYIKVGGGDFKKLVLGALAMFVALGVAIAAATAAGFGGAAAGLAALIAVVVSVGYFARIAMGTAERRGLSRWVGLLMFVPLANLILYPYIAFHDGIRAPNKAGLVLGLLLAFGPLPGQIQMMNMLTQQLQQGSEADADVPSFAQSVGGLGAALEIGTQLAALDELDPSKPEDAAHFRDGLAKARLALDANREALGEEAAGEMESMLQDYEQRLASPAAPLQQSAPSPAAPPRIAAAVPSAPSAPLTASIRRDGDNGFAVPISPPCPPGTTRRGAAPPAGTRQWCEKVGADAGIKHGWMAEYHPNGNPAASGEYQNGLRVGVWTRYYEDGTKRVQAQFENGLQNGVLISWSPDGSKSYEQQFIDGAPSTPASR